MLRISVLLLALLFSLAPTLLLAQDNAPTIKDVLDTDQKTGQVIAEVLEDDTLQPGDTPLTTLLAIMENRANSVKDEPGREPEAFCHAHLSGRAGRKWPAGVL